MLMVVHDLKIEPKYFESVINGIKIFELRKNDRNFQVNDLVRLREFSNGEYTGRVIEKSITYILQGGCYGLEEGYVILSIR